MMLHSTSDLAMFPYYLNKPSSDVLKNTGSQFRFNSVTTDAESLARSGEANLDTRKLVNVVIAKDFNLAPEGIQIQGLEVCELFRCSDLL
jgi:hypothetical protein